MVPDTIFAADDSAAGHRDLRLSDSAEGFGGFAKPGQAGCNAGAYTNGESPAPRSATSADPDTAEIGWEEDMQIATDFSF